MITNIKQRNTDLGAQTEINASEQILSAEELSQVSAGQVPPAVMQQGAKIVRWAVISIAALELQEQWKAVKRTVADAHEEVETYFTEHYEANQTETAQEEHDREEREAELARMLDEEEEDKQTAARQGASSGAASANASASQGTGVSVSGGNAHNHQTSGSRTADITITGGSPGDNGSDYQ